ncbi:MAG: hypothetical protein U5K38_05760 [Woeseiaceae bacterium]|nr:hypothetical protein [Woeseiaceae bacterium]
MGTYKSQVLELACMSREVGDNEPSVVRVSSAFSPISVDMWLVVHRELRTNCGSSTSLISCVVRLRAWYSEKEFVQPLIVLQVGIYLPVASC